MDNATEMIRSLSAAAAESTGAEGGGVVEEEHFHGVHIEFRDLYAVIVFLGAVYAAGIVTSRFLGIPALVGEIAIGVIMGPEVLDLVPFEESWVLLGEIG